MAGQLGHSPKGSVQLGVVRISRRLYFCNVKPLNVIAMKVGQDVVCIDDKFTPEQVALIPNRPVEGSVYTVRDVFTTRMGQAIHLEELRNPSLDHPSGLGTFEPSFSIDRFQPLLTDEEETEIAEAIKETLETVA